MLAAVWSVGLTLQNSNADNTAHVAKFIFYQPWSIRMTEDRDKWRKYVHGVANPQIENG